MCKRGSTSAPPLCLLYVKFQACAWASTSVSPTHPPGVHAYKLPSSSVLSLTPARIPGPLWRGSGGTSRVRQAERSWAATQVMVRDQPYLVEPRRREARAHSQYLRKFRPLGLRLGWRHIDRCRASEASATRPTPTPRAENAAHVLNLSHEEHGHPRGRCRN